MIRVHRDAPLRAQADRNGFVLFRDINPTLAKEWLVRGLLGIGEASTIYGEPGSGKSVLAEDIGLHIAAGWEWHGRTVQQGAVLYVALERKTLVERRASAFRRRYGINDIPFAIVGGVHDFRTKAAADFVAEQCQRLTAETGCPVVLVQLDTLSRGLAGGDENSPKDMGAAVNSTALIQEMTQAHVMWLHHTPINAGERMRGHGALLGAMDVTISVVKGAGARTATVVKANDAEEGQEISFRLESEVVGADAASETTAPVVVPTNDRPSKKPPARKLTDAQKLAMSALDEVIISHGQDAPQTLRLPAGIKVVDAEIWRQQMFKSGALDREAANPRTAYTRLVQQVTARSLAGFASGENGTDLVWRV